MMWPPTASPLYCLWDEGRAYFCETVIKKLSDLISDFHQAFAREELKDEAHNLYTTSDASQVHHDRCRMRMSFGCII